MTISKPRQRAALVLLATLLSVGGLALVPAVQARWMLNRAQLQRLHGQPEPAAFLAALERDPSNAHLRWQTAATLAATDDCRTATDLLLPLVSDPSIPDAATDLLLRCLLANGQHARATSVYTELAEPPLLAPGQAARVLQGFFANGTPPPPAATVTLVSQLATLDPAAPGYAAFVETLGAPDFWQSALGTRLQESLAWAGSDPAPSTAAPAPAPDIARIAAMLNLPADSLTLGNELLLNGLFGGYTAFDDVLPTWQRSLMNQGVLHNIGIFVVGVDGIQPDRATLRVDGIHVERDTTIAAARAGIWHIAPVSVAGNTAYALTLHYRTANLTGETVGIWLTDDERVFQRNDLRLPPADQWQQVTLIFWNRTPTTQTVRPLLRLWGTGSVWFAAVSLREIIPAIGTSLDPRDALVRSEPLP